MKTRPNPATGNIEVIFVFDVKELHQRLDSPNIYWREVITVNPQVRAAIQKLDAKVVGELLKFEAKFGEQQCDWNADWIDEKAALRVAIKPVVSNKHICVVSFSFPQDVNVNWAILTSPEPSFSPRMECRLKLNGYRLDYAPFFQARLQGDDCLQKSDHIRITLMGYVSVRSGVVFTWRPEDQQDIAHSAPVVPR